MFGQTIKSSGGGRGRKKGYEVPGHKWVKRIPTPSGGWRYIYDTAKLAQYKVRNSKGVNALEDALIDSDPYYKDRASRKIVKGLNRVRKRLDINSNGTLDTGDISLGARLAKRKLAAVGRNVSRSFRKKVNSVKNKINKLGKSKWKKNYDNTGAMNYYDVEGKWKPKKPARKNNKWKKGYDNTGAMNYYDVEGKWKPKKPARKNNKWKKGYDNTGVMNYNYVEGVRRKSKRR